MAKKQKTYTGLKVYSVIVSIILVVAIVLLACAFGLGWIRVTPEEDPSVVTEPTPDVEDENPEGMIVEEGESYGIELLAEADGLTYTITATAYDENGLALDSYQYFTFSMAWSVEKDEEVEAYVTMETTANTATFSCLQPFDTQIIVTVVNDINNELSATATIDYYMEVKGITVNGTEITGADVPVIDFEYEYFSDDDLTSWWEGYTYNYGGEIIYGVGSLANEATVTVTISVDRTFIFLAEAAVEDYLGSSWEGDLTTSVPESFTLPENTCNASAFWCNLLGEDIEDSSLLLAFLQYALRDTIYETSNQVTVTVTITPTYGEEITYSYICNMTFAESDITDMEIDRDEIIFPDQP